MPNKFAIVVVVLTDLEGHTGKYLVRCKRNKERLQGAGNDESNFLGFDLTETRLHRLRTSAGATD